MKNNFLFLIILAFPFLGNAMEDKLWFDKDFLIHWNNSYTYQYYPRINYAGNLFQQDTSCHFFKTGLSMAVFDTYHVEVETSFFQTKNHNLTFESAYISGQYLLLNDVVADPFSLIIGATFRGVGSSALRDISVFYHGEIELEGYLSVGLETSCMQFWTQRTWLMTGLGIANRGNPWAFANLYWEANSWDQYRFGVFLSSLFGLGHHDLNIATPFQGYQSIDHRACDLGFSLYYALNALNPFSSGSLAASYSYRIYAKNAPAMAHTLTLRISYPFSF